MPRFFESRRSPESIFIFVGNGKRLRSLKSYELQYRLCWSILGKPAYSLFIKTQSTLDKSAPAHLVLPLDKIPEDKRPEVNETLTKTIFNDVT